MIRSRVARLPAAPRSCLPPSLSRVSRCRAWRRRWPPMGTPRGNGRAAGTGTLALASSGSRASCAAANKAKGRRATRKALAPTDRVREAVVAGLLPEELSAQHLRLARARGFEAQPSRAAGASPASRRRSGRRSHYAVQASASSEGAKPTIRWCGCAVRRSIPASSRLWETYVIKARLADALARTGRQEAGGSVPGAGCARDARGPSATATNGNSSLPAATFRRSPGSVSCYRQRT